MHRCGGARRGVVLYLRNPTVLGDCYLVGTAHVGQGSRVEVSEVIKLVSPKTVVLELCPQRRNALLQLRRLDSGARDTADKLNDDNKGHKERGDDDAADENSGAEFLAKTARLFAPARRVHQETVVAY